MPPLTFIKPAGGLKFASHQLKLPVQFKKPSDQTGADQYGKAFKPGDKGAMPKLIPPWFMPAEAGNKYYQDSCDKIGSEYKSFHDAMLDAIGFSHNLWKAQAKFKDIKINAAIALGTPGCLDGPELESNIKMAPMVASFTGNKAKHRDAVAKGVSKCFKSWQDMVIVPGLPWYPAFIAFPGPMAPPMPNVPMPLITCPSAKMADMAPMALQKAMDDALDGDLKNKDPDKHYEALHDAIATVLSAAFMLWLPAQQVMNVMGKGQIPTFAPPVVPVGPVVMGDVLPIPGHLAL